MGGITGIRHELVKDRSLRSRLIRDSAWILAIAAVTQGALTQFGGRWGVDSHAYWDAWHGQMYTSGPDTLNAYLYSPAFAQVVWPLTKLGWPVFALIFSVGTGAALAWLLAPLGWRLAVPLWLAGLQEIVSGNIFALFALVIVLGFRLPGLWALPLLTKISLGLGPLWFLARFEWRRFGVALLWTAAISAGSFWIAPELWREWASFLVNHAADANRSLGSAALPPLIVRAPLALALLVWGARRNRVWVLPVCMVLAAPVLWLGSFAMLAALPRLIIGSRPAVSAVSDSTMSGEPCVHLSRPSAQPAPQA